MRMHEAIATQTTHEHWQLAEGEEIAPGRTALKRLGGGRRYDAYLAWDDRLHALCVCKLVRPHLVGAERALAGLTDEWEMLVRLNHPVIVRPYDLVGAGPIPHLALEHVEGPRLSTLVRRYGPLPVEQLVPLALQLSAAIHYLGTTGVVHLDVKPSNTIMAGPPRLIDLSVAMELHAAADLQRPVGTDAYMPPEQCDPARLGPIGTAADVWGLGATLYKAATGEAPFARWREEGGQATQRWPQLDRPPVAPVRLPGAFAEVITACLDPDPAARPSPAAVHAALEPILGGLPKPRLGRLKPRL
jgi:eukaryotic-like serine/threonine-protein kinase